MKLSGGVVDVAYDWVVDRRPQRSFFLDVDHDRSVVAKRRNKLYRRVGHRNEIDRYVCCTYAHIRLVFIARQHTDARY